MIKLGNINMRQFVKDVYDLSKPQGMGFLHFQAGGLTDEEAGEIIQATARGRIAVSMDYVRGRACKMHVIIDETGALFIDDDWYDHSDRQFDELLSRHGIKREG